MIIRKTIDQVIIVGIGDCFKPVLDFHDDKEVLLMHEDAFSCDKCSEYWQDMIAVPEADLKGEIYE